MGSILRIIFLSLVVVFKTSTSQRLGITKMNPDDYCPGRPEGEYFRKIVPENSEDVEFRRECNIFYRCISAGAGTKVLSQFKCSGSMYFDVEQQTCNLKRRVDNCYFHEKERPPLPRWPIPYGSTSNCPTGEIECGTGECLPSQKFCDDYEDCTDGSDENICTPGLDPNGSERCNPDACLLAEGCFCSVDGTQIPGKLELAETPQMIIVTFSGAVNNNSFVTASDIFNDVTNKGTGCTAKATFFVSHAYTNYSAVQELHRRGHEIATHSITNKNDPKYWRYVDQEEFRDQFDNGRNIISEFSKISVDDIWGMRVPGGRVAGNKQFRMMSEWGFLYDSSIAAPRSILPIWPYTVHYKIPHKCLGIDQQCPSQPFPVWSMPINELDRRDDFKLEERLTGCHFVDSCSNIIEEKQFEYFLDNNLNHHYAKNRAPFGLHFTSAYFELHPKLKNVFKKWVKKISEHGDYFFVTNQEAIQWMLKPTPIADIDTFVEWKEKCLIEGPPACSLPNPCSNRVARLFPNEDSMFLYTCAECPNTYPWLHDPYGYGDFETEILK